MLTRSFKKGQFPQQSGPYKVGIKNRVAWQEHNACRLHISVGQHYNEGEKLAAMLNWGAGRFAAVHLCVNDTLQRHNLVYAGMEINEAARTARSAGDSWLKRHSATIAAHPGLLVHRWDDWTADPDYLELHGVVAHLDETHAAFHSALNQDIGAIWRRRHNVDPDAFPAQRAEAFRNCARSFLREEIAAMCLMIRRFRALDVYRGSMLSVFDQFKENTPEGAPAELAQRDFARIDFSRNGKSRRQVQTRSPK